MKDASAGDYRYEFWPQSAAPRRLAGGAHCQRHKPRQAPLCVCVCVHSSGTAYATKETEHWESPLSPVKVSESTLSLPLSFCLSPLPFSIPLCLPLCVCMCKELCRVLHRRLWHKCQVQLAYLTCYCYYRQVCLVRIIHMLHKLKLQLKFYLWMQNGKRCRDRCVCVCVKY